jgi:hypothetical protein
VEFWLKRPSSAQKALFWLQPAAYLFKAWLAKDDPVDFNPSPMELNSAIKSSSLKNPKLILNLNRILNKNIKSLL